MKKYFPLVLLLGCIAAFAAGVFQLFKLRFESGDVYPPYSSLRADPLGSMALYESLEKLPGYSVRRDYSTNNRLPDGPGTAYLHLASDRFEWTELPDDIFKEIEMFLSRGGRLVITLLPDSSGYTPFQRVRNRQYQSDPDKDEKPKDEKSKDEKNKGEKAPVEKKTDQKKDQSKDEIEDPDSKDKKVTDKKIAEDKGKAEKSKDEKSVQRTNPTGKKAKRKRPGQAEDVSIKERWGLDFGMVPLEQGTNDAYEPVRVKNKTDLPLPGTLDWHSGVVFTNLDKAWHVIYARGSNAVVIERKFGHGSVAFATDSYFISNEALEKDRHADLLAWVIGPVKNVVFDEAHLGVAETSGVAVLMRKYRLHGLALGLILLAGLFIWKNAVSLVPPHEDESKRDFVTGKNAAAGFVNLLRRNIPLRDLLAACFDEWKKSAAQSGKYSEARRRQAEAAFVTETLLPLRDRRPLETYREICGILQKQKQTPEKPKPPGE
jgi:hypothetical protein